MADSGPGRLSAWALTLEAALLLVLARALIAMVSFGSWRHWLGRLQASGTAASGDTVPMAQDWRIASAVERACWRLRPLAMKCLPRAMALHWMLQRRNRPSVLALAILAPQARGTLDDLHAWVEVGTAVLIGASEKPYAVLARFGSGN
ncbi:MAG: lasso peptide biosynthesis B2 protein [Sphingomonadales bacterium]|nr:lasso peptide biosynthesis B2 protein [Sphingomonadales bacterium]